MKRIIAMKSIKAGEQSVQRDAVNNLPCFHLCMKMAGAEIEGKSALGAGLFNTKKNNQAAARSELHSMG